MDWVEIKDISPNNETQVLLYGIYDGKHCYNLGMLGGCKNAPEFVIDIGGGNKMTVKATHWCKLTKP